MYVSRSTFFEVNIDSLAAARWFLARYLHKFLDISKSGGDSHRYFNMATGHHRHDTELRVESRYILRVHRRAGDQWVALGDGTE